MSRSIYILIIIFFTACSNNYTAENEFIKNTEHFDFDEFYMKKLKIRGYRKKDKSFIMSIFNKNTFELESYVIDSLNSRSL